MVKTRRSRYTQSTFVPSRPLKTLDDLIAVVEEWVAHRGKTKETDILCFTDIEYTYLNDALPYIKQLNELVGLGNLKKAFLRQILQYVQGFNNGEMNNVIITGPPGVGKTTVCHIFAKIYHHVGLLRTDKVRTPQKSDLVAKYLGQTAHLTKTYLEESLDGVVFIDEAYSLFTGKGDSYATEAIDVINGFLSDQRYRHRIVCILAGYEKDIETRIMPLNEGLRSRFPWVFNIEPYLPEDLADIFIYRVENPIDTNAEPWGWSFDREDLVKIIKDNKDLFPHNGRDCEHLLTSCKIAHSLRIFPLVERVKRQQRGILNLEDVHKGIASIKRQRNKRKRTDLNTTMMYI